MKYTLDILLFNGRVFNYYFETAEEAKVFINVNRNIIKSCRLNYFGKAS